MLNDWEAKLKKKIKFHILSHNFGHLLPYLSSFFEFSSYRYMLLFTQDLRKMIITVSKIFREEADKENFTFIFIQDTQVLSLHKFHTQNSNVITRSGRLG